MKTLDDIKSWQGRTVVDEAGDKIGTIEAIYLDQQSGEPEWLTVSTGLFGTKTTFVPIEGAQSTGDGVRVAYAKDHVKDAPNVDPDGQLSSEEEQQLYSHYGRGDYDEWNGTGGDWADDDASGTVGHDTSGPDTDNAMTRSEEELRVGTEKREAGRARLRKYVVTENVETTVPVEREEVRVEREPITDANADSALDGPAISEEEHEVVLHEERPVVDKQVVPKERVRLERDTHIDEESVSEDVRKERIETEGDAR
jgi:uncharacterized protein (TIGR02271 family)